MTDNKSGEDTNNKGKQDRSVSIGQAKNVQVTSGDNARVNTVFEGQQVVITTQDFVRALAELKKILIPAGIESIKQQEMEQAIIEAEAEAEKDKPDKVLKHSEKSFPEPYYRTPKKRLPESTPK